MEKKAFLIELSRKGIFILDEEINEGITEFLRGLVFHFIFRNPGKQVFLIIDSNGGFVVPALAFYDFIKALPEEVVGIVIGKCHSAALLILAACQKRLALRHSQFFFHEISYPYKLDDQMDLEEFFAEQLKIQNTTFSHLYKVFEKEFGLSVQESRELGRKGKEYKTKLFAEEVLKYNVIHEIIEKLPFELPSI